MPTSKTKKEKERRGMSHSSLMAPAFRFSRSKGAGGPCKRSRPGRGDACLQSGALLWAVSGTQPQPAQRPAPTCSPSWATHLAAACFSPVHTRTCHPNRTKTPNGFTNFIPTSADRRCRQDHQESEHDVLCTFRRNCVFQATDCLLFHN